MGKAKTPSKTADKTAAKPPAWKSLKHARGAATKVPELLDKVLHPGPPTPGGESPYQLLRLSLVGQGVWYDASAPAVGLILDTVPSAENPAWLFRLAADILGGDQLQGWLTRPIEPVDPHAKAAHDAAVERKAVLLGGLGHASGLVRGAAAMALAMVPGLAEESVPALVKAAEEDADEMGRAGALLALGRLGIGNAAAAKAIDAARGASAKPLCRGAAGMAWLRQDEKRSFDQAKEDLQAWLGFGPPETVEMPWFERTMWYRALSFADSQAYGLSGLAKSRGKAGIEAFASTAVQLSKIEDGAVESQLAKIMLDFGGFPTEPPAPPIAPLPEALPEDRRAFAKKMAETHLLPSGGYGLPASGAVRRRWLGMEPPGPLDKRVPGAGGATVPLWSAWPKRMPEPGDFASPLDRWEGLVEYAAASYPPFFRAPKKEEIEGEVSALPVNDEMRARVKSVADDLADRLAAAARTGTTGYYYLNASRLLLLPAIRSGMPIPEKWDVLFYISNEPESRELLGALPPDRRERALIAYLHRTGAPDTLAKARVVLSLLDLAPTPKVADALRWAIDRIRETPNSADAVSELTRGLEEATKKHPSAAS